MNMSYTYFMTDVDAYVIVNPNGDDVCTEETCKDAESVCVQLDTLFSKEDDHARI